MIDDGHLIFSGVLTNDNIDVVCEHMDKVIGGKRFTFVVCNEVFGFTPEIHVGASLENVEPYLSHYTSDMTGETHHSIRLDTDGWCTSLHPSYDDIRKPVKVTILTNKIEVHQHAPNGNRLIWCWKPEPPLSEEEVEILYAKVGVPA